MADQEQAIKSFIERNYPLAENAYHNSFALWVRAAFEAGYKLGYETARREKE